MRVKPALCRDCLTEAWECPSCGDYRCKCSNPFQVLAWEEARAENPHAKRPRLMGSKHYDKTGRAYTPKFTVEPYPDEDEDITWLIEGGFSG